MNRFNPCCDGLYKRTVTPKVFVQIITPCFNPCCDGLYKRTRVKRLMRC